MLRFIDIRGQGTGCRFSFWHTTNFAFWPVPYDSYLAIRNIVAWESWEECHEDMQDAQFHPDLIARLKGLCPEWVTDGREDDMEQFYDRRLSGLIVAPNPKGKP